MKAITKNHAIIFLCAILIFCGFVTPTPAADAPSAMQPTEKPKWPGLYPYPIGVGIQGLAAASPNIVLADVLQTNPRKAIEGARDNAQLKVVESLFGSTHAGETIDVYYHLGWIDDKNATLEPPKFANGQRYLVFLTAQQQSLGDYELSDPILGILPDRPRQTAEAAAAIRVAHGDARGRWSDPVAAFQARLVAWHNPPKNLTPIISLALDLLNVTGGDGTSQFDLSRATITWQVTDEKGKVIPPNAPAGDRPKFIHDQKVILESRQTTRLPLSQSADDIPKDTRGYLSIAPGQAWSFDRADHAAYFLSGTLTVPRVTQNIWWGTITLPQLLIPLD